MAKNFADQFVLSPTEFEALRLTSILEGNARLIANMDGRRIAATIAALRRAIKAQRAYHANNSGDNAREHTEAIKAVKEWL